MAKGKAQFAAVPTRAISDRELTDGEFRVLAAVTSFDRMSSVRGTGQGAWASHINMAALAGCNYARFSTAISKLMRLGYLEREPRVTNRKQYTYRVIYTAADGLPHSKHKAADDVCATVNNDENLVCRTDAENARIVCREGELSSSDDCDNRSQYISLREGIDLVETSEIDSVETAHLAVRHARQEVAEPNIGAELAQFERAFKEAPDTLNLPAWIMYLQEIPDLYWDQDNIVGQANRLLEEAIECLSEDDYQAWQLGEGPFALREGAA